MCLFYYNRSLLFHNIKIICFKVNSYSMILYAIVVHHMFNLKNYLYLTKYRLNNEKDNNAD